MHALDLLLPLVWQVMYDSLPSFAFFALVAAIIGAYMFYAGNKVRQDCRDVLCCTSVAVV